MFASSFEKTAFHLPGQQTLARLAGKGLSAVGRAVGGIHSGAGAAMQRGGGSLLHHAAKIGSEKTQQALKSSMITKNKALKMQGKPELKISDKGIKRHADIKAGKELESQLPAVAGKGNEVKKQNFIQRHPYISAAGIGYGAYKIGQSPGDQTQRPLIGQ